MTKINRLNFLFFILISIIILMGFYLRYHRYSQIPFPGESLDEYSFSWLGLSLIEQGIPIATSGLPSYKHLYKYINVDQYYHSGAIPNPIPIDQPWFDHPPLLGLITGGYSFIKGVRNFSDASVIYIRKPMLIIGTLNIILLFIFITLIYNKYAALIASLIYSTDPLIVISSRMVQAENLIITFFLLSLISFFLYIKKNNNNFLWLAITFSGLATLTKVSGWSVPIALILLSNFFSTKKLENFLKILGGNLAMFSLFIFYGFSYNIHLFLSVWMTNSGRYFREGLLSFYNLFTTQNITRDFSSGWILAGWIAVFIIAFQVKQKSRNLWIILPLLSYLFIFLLFGSENYGWYKFPFYPFLIGGLGLIFYDLIEEGDLLLSIFILVLPFSIMTNRFFPANEISNKMVFYRLGLLGLAAIIFSSFYYKNKLIWRIIILLLISSVIIINIYTNSIINISTWYNKNLLQSI